MVVPISENHDAESPTCVRQIHPTLVPVFNRIPLFQVSTASGLVRHTNHDHDGVIHKQIMHSVQRHKVSTTNTFISHVAYKDILCCSIRIQELFVEETGMYSLA